MSSLPSEPGPTGEASAVDPAALAPDPMADPPADHAGQRLRRWVRGVVGIVVLAALITVVVRGLYVVWQVRHQQAPY